MLFGNVEVHININPMPANEIYRKYTHGILDQIFIPGDSISGHLQIIIPNHEIIKHRGITISVVGKYYAGNTSFESFQIASKDVIQTELSHNLETDFSFENLSFPYSSYNGKLFSIKYFIVLRIFRYVVNDISAFSPFYVIIPQNPPSDLLPMGVVLAPPSGIRVRFDIDATIVPVDGRIKGFLSIERFPIKIMSISLQLKKIEKLKMFGTSKDEIWNSEKYELISGTPNKKCKFLVLYFLRINNDFPTMIPRVKECRIRTKFYLKFTIVDALNTVYEQENLIELYQPYVSH